MKRQPKERTFYFETYMGAGLSKHRGIVRARKELAHSEGKANLTKVRPATEADIAWVQSMGGVCAMSQHPKDELLKRADEWLADNPRGYGQPVDIVESLRAALREQQPQAPSAVNVETLVREIHQRLKRGERTQDHGLIGNLRCILDHLIEVPDMFEAPSAPAADAVVEQLQRDLLECRRTGKPGELLRITERAIAALRSRSAATENPNG